METKDYVKIFRLDQENFQFNRGEFMNKMGEDLLEVCQRQQNQSAKYKTFIPEFMEGILCNSGSAPKKILVPRNTKKDRGNEK